MSLYSVHIENSLPPPGADFEYDLSKWEIGKVLPTKQLAAMLKGYGGFPESVLVRKEMTVLWGVLVEKMVTQNLGVALVGSPGVGKSVIVVLFSLFLAMVRGENILLLRTVKDLGTDTGILVGICLRGPSKKIVVYPRWSTIARATDLLGIFYDECRRDNETYRLVVDGLDQHELSGTALKNFDLLATSAHYDRKDDDPHALCVLPAWQKLDLKLYAELKHPGLSPEAFDLYYGHSGGNLRNFIRADRDLEELRIRISGNVLDTPCETTMSAILCDYYTRGDAALDQLQRIFVMDRNNPAHYDDSREWRKVVDSFFARRQLTSRLTLESIKSSMRVAEASGLATGTWYE
jgi:hypothetical protein